MWCLQWLWHRHANCNSECSSCILYSVARLLWWWCLAIVLFTFFRLKQEMLTCVSRPVSELVCSPEPGSSQRNDLTGSCWCRAGWPSSACCCSCCSCSALAKLRGWGHRSAPVWMKAGLSASAITTVSRAQGGVTPGREWKPSLEFSEVVKLID